MSQKKTHLLAIQARMSTSDYGSQQAFFERLLDYMERAQAQAQLGPQTVVVFPEYIGAWLVLVDEGVADQTAPHWAALSLIARQPLRYLAQLGLSYQWREPLFEACYRLKAPQMAQIYFKVFSELAKRYQCTIVAGSIVLPGAQIEAGNLVVNQGKLGQKMPLQNISLVFKSSGEVYPEIVRKHFLTSEERGYTSPGYLTSLPYFDTPIGRLGVLICADAWFPACYQRLDQQQVDYVVAPVMITDPLVHTAMWKGYDHAEPPMGAWRDELGRITHAEAWRRYTLRQGMQGTRIKQGLLSCLQGQVLAFKSTALAIAHGELDASHVADEEEFIWLEL